MPSEDFDTAISEITQIYINLMKESYESLGINYGKTENDIDWRNYMVDDPISFDDGLYLGDGGEIDFTGYTGGIISIEKLLSIYPGANKNYATAALIALEKYGGSIGLSDKGKLLVLAQFALESGNFKFTHELGYGKGKKYGVPTGPYNQIYYGRGPIQITWEANYKAITEQCFPKIGINADIHRNPDLCCSNLIVGCAASLCWFMLPGNGKRAIAAANAGDVVGLTRAINGGTAGLSERIKNTQKILAAVI